MRPCSITWNVYIKSASSDPKNPTATHQSEDAHCYQPEANTRNLSFPSSTTPPLFPRIPPPPCPKANQRTRLYSRLPRCLPSPTRHSPDVRWLVEAVEAGGEGQQRHEGQQGPPAGRLEALRASSRLFEAPRRSLGDPLRARGYSSLGPTAAPPGT